MKEGEIMQKKNQIEFKVSGKYALFTDPFAVSGGEKTSYMIPTYEALKVFVRVFILNLHLLG